MGRWVTFLMLIFMAAGSAGCASGFSSLFASQAQNSGASTAILPAAAFIEASPTSIVPVMMNTVEIYEAYPDENFVFLARYPQLDWANDPRVEPFNLVVANFIQAELEQFRQFAVQSAAYDGEEVGGFFDIQYQLITSNYGILSFEFLTESYFAPAAHPALRTHTINYDMVAGRALSLDELFVPAAPYLELLSQACLQQLAARSLDPNPNEVQPALENYRSWNITEAGLRVVFDENRVAPYAEGRQVLVIPYRALESLLLPQGRLEGFLQP